MSEMALSWGDLEEMAEGMEVLLDSGEAVSGLRIREYRLVGLQGEVQERLSIKSFRGGARGQHDLLSYPHGLGERAEVEIREFRAGG